MCMFKVRKGGERGYQVYAKGYPNGDEGSIFCCSYKYEGAAQNLAERLNAYVELVVESRVRQRMSEFVQILPDDVLYQLNDHLKSIITSAMNREDGGD